MRQPHPDKKNHQAQTIVANTAPDCQIRSKGNQAPAAQWVIGGQKTDDRGQTSDVGRQIPEFRSGNAACDEPFGCELKVERLSRAEVRKTEDRQFNQLVQPNKRYEHM